MNIATSNGNVDKMQELFYKAYDSLEIKEFDSYQEQLKYEKEIIIPRLIEYLEYYYKSLIHGKTESPELFVLLIAHLFRRIIDSNDVDFEWDFVKGLRDDTEVVRNNQQIDKILYMIRCSLINSNALLDFTPLFSQIEYAANKVDSDNLNYFRWNFGIKKLCIGLASNLQIALAILLMNSSPKASENSQDINRFNKDIANINRIILRDVLGNDSDIINSDLANQMAEMITNYVAIYMTPTDEEVNLIFAMLMKLGGQKKVDEFITRWRETDTNARRNGYSGPTSKI